MEYKSEIRRSKRKTVSLSILEDGRLLIKAPLFLPDREIESIVNKHDGWIKKHMRQTEQRMNRKAEFSFQNGQLLPYLGTEYPILEAGGRKVQFDGKAIYLPQGEREKLAADWYRQKAKEMLCEWVNCYSKVMGVSPADVKITSAATRWGSCSAKNSLCFPYRLICMPVDAIESVVVHELAHITVKNHSKKFYAEIEKTMPDYRKRYKKLKEFAQRIPF